MKLLLKCIHSIKEWDEELLIFRGWRLLEQPATCSMSYSVTLWLLHRFNTATWKNLKMYRNVLQPGGAFHIGRPDLTHLISEDGSHAPRCWTKRERFQHFPGTCCQRLVTDFLEMSDGNKLCGISTLKGLDCATSHLGEIASQSVSWLWLKISFFPPCFPLLT